MFYQPVDVHFGWDSHRTLPRLIGKLGFKRVLLLTGKESLKKAGLWTPIRDSLSTVPALQVIEYQNVAPNPTVSDIARAADDLRGEKMDGAVAIGGGSVLDFTKSICALIRQPGSAIVYLREEKPLSDDALPWIAVPTTSGTGSEVTCWATVWDLEKKVKRSLGGRSMYARAAIVDPALTLTLPPSLTAITALDALSHAMEALWAKARNPVSDALARDAIRFISGHFLAAYQNPSDRAAREKLSLGSLMAGLAFSQTKTAGVHSTSYPLTIHFNVPHGLACGLLLIPFLEFNAPAAPDAIRQILAGLGVNTIPEAQKKIATLIAGAGLPSHLSVAGVPFDGIDTIVDNANTPGRADNNPRALDKGPLKELLTRYFQPVLI